LMVNEILQKGDNNIMKVERTMQHY